MAFAAFLNIEGIPGESTDQNHQDWIEILAYNHDIEQKTTGSTSSGGARSAGRADHGALRITKALDKASPKLALACCKGDHVGKVVLELCRDTGDQQKYMEYKLSDVLISSVNPGGDARSEETLPQEVVSFNYGKIEWTYTELDHATGQPKGNVGANWNVEANKGS